MRRIRLRWLVLLALVVALPLAGWIALMTAIDPARFLPQAAEAVRRNTGRVLTVNGPTSVSWGWSPVIEAQNVALSNIDGGSRPAMLTVDRVDATISLLPLLWRSVYVQKLQLVRPDLLLESNARGEPNWRFAPAPARQAGASPTPSEQGQAAAISFGGPIQAANGVVTQRHGAEAGVLTVRRLDLTAADEDSPITLGLDGGYNGAPLKAEGEFGSLTRLLDANQIGVWPARLTLTVGQASATFAGSFSRPSDLRGYKLKVDGAAPDLATLRPFATGAALPAFKDVSFSAQLADVGGAPRISAATLHAGASDLSDSWPGLTLRRLDVTATRADDQPIRLAAEGGLSGAAFTANGSFGAPSALLASGPVAAPFPVNLSVTTEGANVSLRGVVAVPLRLSGFDLVVRGAATDLAQFSPAAQYPLPALKNVTFHGRVHDRDGSFANGVVARDVGFTSAQGDLSGDFTLGLGASPTAQGTLTASRINGDDLWAAFPPPLPALPALPSDAPPAAADGDATAAPAWMISDAPLPFDVLPRASADLRVKIATLVLGGAIYQNAAGKLAVANGRLQFDASATQGGRQADGQGGSPGGPQSGGRPMMTRVVADGSQTPPPVMVVLRSPGLPLKPLATMLSLPNDVSGSLEVDLDLRGVGQTPHALASGLRGRVGLASVDGRIGGRLLNALAGPVLRRAGVTGPRPGELADLRCFATRLDASQGVATLRGLLLDTSGAYLAGGGGSANFADETLSLRIDAGPGGLSPPVPVRISGPFRDPRYAVEAPPSGSGSGGGADRGAASIDLLSRLPLDGGGSGGSQMECLRQLSLARDGRAGPSPAYYATPALPPLPTLPPTPIPLPYQPPPVVAASPPPALGGGAPVASGPPPAPAPAGQGPINLLDILRPKAR